MKTMYLVAMQGMYGPELSSGQDCLFSDGVLADRLVKAYHANGQKYMKMFYLTVVEDDAYIKRIGEQAAKEQAAKL